jgi:hypothetical protein
VDTNLSINYIFLFLEVLNDKNRGLYFQFDIDIVYCPQ